MFASLPRGQIRHGTRTAKTSEGFRIVPRTPQISSLGRETTHPRICLISDVSVKGTFCSKIRDYRLSVAIVTLERRQSDWNSITQAQSKPENKIRALLGQTNGPFCLASSFQEGTTRCPQKAHSEHRGQCLFLLLFDINWYPQVY